MKRRKISPSLERVVRGIHDSAEFVTHIGNIADRYRREFALETGPRGREVRLTLRTFRKHADGLMHWLSEAQRKPGSLEFEALARIGAVVQSAPNQTLASSANIVAWLDQAVRSAALADAQLAPNKTERSTPRIAAEALRATFERHSLKWSTQVSKKSSSSAVQLLCAIAKSAGDEITPQQARMALNADQRKTS